MSEIWAYDIETYRNFLSYVFVRIEPNGTPGELREFVVFGDRDDRRELGEWFRKTRPELAGYNNYAFDDLILVQTLMEPETAPVNVYKTAQNLIAKRTENITGYGRLVTGRDQLRSIDLMLVLGKYNSLKELEGKLGLSIEELPFPFDSEIVPANVERLLAYNKHDVMATVSLFRELADKIETRRAIGSQFKIHALACTDSTLGIRIFESLYTVPRDKRRGTERESISLTDIISNQIVFDTPELQTVLSRIRGLTLIKANNFSFTEKVSLAGVTYSLGVGGLHSEDEPGRYELGKIPQIIRDADVTSYYPSIMLNLGIVPEHLGTGFLDSYRGIVDKRIKAKQAGDNTTANSLKIAINSVYGKFKDQHSWLYDPRAQVAVTLNGQLLLLDLIEKLTQQGITIISGNTDGFISLVDPSLAAAYDSICQSWVERTGFQLEFTDYFRYVRKDVNNYVAQTYDGKVKGKGIFAEKKELGDGYQFPIIARAIREWFINGTPPEQTVAAETGIMAFVQVFKPGHKFDMVYQSASGERIPTGKVNRFYVSRSGGQLIKTAGGSDTRVITRPVSLVNGELPAQLPDDLDTSYYLYEINRIIAYIDSPVTQLNLFGVGSSDSGYSRTPLIPESENLSEFRESLKTLQAERDISNPNVLQSTYTLSEIVDAMRAIEEKNGTFRAPCPVHEGKNNRSLILSEGDAGLHLHCFAGCSPRSILVEIERRLSSGEEFRFPERDELGVLVATYEYQDEFGRVRFRKHRFDPKAFRYSHAKPTIGNEPVEYQSGMGSTQTLIYRLPQVLKSQFVVIVEGEKDADSGNSLSIPGYAFTTNPNGASEWNSSHSLYLADKEIFIIPDNDPPGRTHAKDIANSVLTVSRSVTIVPLPGPGKDLTDWITAGGTADQLLALFAAAEPIKPGSLFEETDLLRFDPGDIGNGRAVLRLYKSLMAFSDSFGDMFYNSTYWIYGAKATAEIKLAIEQGLTRRKNAAFNSKDEAERKLADSSRPTPQRINTVYQYIRSLITISKDQFDEFFRNPPGFLNVRNGVVDLRTGTLYPHHSSYGFTYRLAAEYDPEYRSTLWEQFLAETIPDEDERNYLQEVIGYAFTGENTEGILVYINGPTRSGKGTLTETIQYLAGAIAAEISIGTLIDKRSASDQNFDLAGLFHARFVHASESRDSDWLDNAKIKLLTGGNYIRAAHKGRDFFTFRPQFTVFITSNESIKMKSEDEAAWTRVRAIEFPHSKSGIENKQLKVDLRTRENQIGILSWIVEGAKRFYSRERGLATPSSVQERTQGFRDQLDYIMEFVRDNYEVADDMSDWEWLKKQGFYMTNDRLFEDYSAWKEPNGAADLKKIAFIRKLRQRLGGVNQKENTTRVSIDDPITGKGTQTRVVAGIRQKTPADIDLGFTNLL